MYPRVSVIIPAFNAANTIEDLIKSLINQSFSRDKIEIIVVDDCSKDNTLEIITKLKKEYHLNLYSHEVNKGLAAARNTGIRNSSGKILIFIDADMVVHDNYIENHVNFHNNRDVMGLVGGIKPAEGIKYDKYQKYLYEAKRGTKKYSSKPAVPYYVFLFNNTSVKREVIDACGLFDENIRIYGGEDTEFAFRIVKKFPGSLYCSHTLTATHNHYRSLDNALKNLYEFAQTNIPYIINKHPEMSGLYKLKFIDKNYDNSSIIYRLAGRLISCKIAYGLNKFLYKISPYPVSNLFVRALMGHKLFTGIQQGLKNEPDSV
jgi:glycosyltransferase involved in cell wall biosynthesis